MNLSKVFNTINHDLLLAKLKYYGFSENPLTLSCIMSQNGQTHFKNLAANAARF